MYKGPQFQRLHTNWKSVKSFEKEVQASITKDINRGRKSGPFPLPPTVNFVSSPMGAFRKRLSNKVRTIHDLSWKPGSAVNDFIGNEVSSVQYITVDHAVEMIKKSGRGALQCKIDMEDAYKNIIVRPEDWNLLGSSWTDDEGNTVFYIDHVLPFGLRSSARLFDNFASCLEFFMRMAGCQFVLHYLDDFWTCGSPGTMGCYNNLDKMLWVCSATGMPVNHGKTVIPVTCLEFLGVEIDSVEMELRISLERMSEVRAELDKWQARRSGTKRELLSLIGKLVFLARVIKPGRTFLRRLFDMSSSVSSLHHKVTLTLGAMEDIRWLCYVSVHWNRKSAFYDQVWTRSDVLQLATDASNWGFGGVFSSSWFIERFSSAERQRPIAWRELLALVWACALWGPRLVNKRLIILCDNQSVVYSVNKGASKNHDMMVLVRLLYHITVEYNFDCRLSYINTVDNNAADALSRGDIQRFRSVLPHAKLHPCELRGSLDSRSRS